ADVRRDVLDQVAACRRRRDHRADLQGARREAWLRLRRVGLADRIPRDHCVVTRRRQPMTNLLARIRIALVAVAVLMIAGFAAPASAQQVNPTAESVNEQTLLQELNKIQGRGSIPDTKAWVIQQPRGRDWREFHEVTLKWIGAIAIVGMLAILVAFYL